MKIKRNFLRNFTVPNQRLDVLATLLLHIDYSGKKLFPLILTDNGISSADYTRQGWIFETLCQIMVLCKCVRGLDYMEIYDGHLQNLNR